MHKETIAAWPQDTDDASRILPLGARPPCRILVVDDDELVRARLAGILSASHYEVAMAASGAEALRVLNEAPCHIVLTDWQMPDMDGLSLCRLVRMRAQEHYVYVLMLTVRDSHQDLLTGLAAGADDYVVKGASVEEILARLETGRRITLTKESVNRHLALTHTDPATGVHNLRYLVQHLPRELARSQRYGRSLAILTCSIDGFERLSSASGLEAGNDLLRDFVGRTLHCIRKVDWLARTSRDEFIVVLPETTSQGARCVARKLRHLFVRDPLLQPNDSNAFTVRIGVTAVEARHDPDSTRQIDALLRSATVQSLADFRFDEEPSTAAGSPRGNHGIH
jgi:two-component system, cell cycle response regulator